MTSVPPPVHAGGGSGDAVVGAMGGLGEAIDCTNLRSFSLEGPHVLWLVVDGAMDLFAIDAVEQGHWHFLGRLQTGTLLLGPVEGPRHTLAARPLQGLVLRRIQLRELYRPEYEYGVDDTGQWSFTGADGILSPLEDAFARGIGRSMRVLFEAPADGRHGRGPGEGIPGGAGQFDSAEDDIEWMPLDSGCIEYGSAYSMEAAADLLIEGSTWQRMVNQQARLQYALDHWIEQLERAHEDRAAEGLRAGKAVRAQADQALLASIGTGGGSLSRRGAPTDDATLAVCRMVAGASGIEVTPPTDGGNLSDRLNPVERIALSSRFRTRVVKLSDRWWREYSGPLVGYLEETGAPIALMWRRGGYDAVDPVSGRRRRVDKDNASAFEPRAVMFYRPLPDEPVGLRRLLRISMGGTRMDVRNLVLGGLVTVLLGALVPIATGKVLGVYVPNAQTDLITQVSLAIVLTSVASAAFGLMQNVSILRMEGRIESTLQPAVWDRLLRLPTRFFSRRSTGELAQAAMGISSIRRVLSGISSVAVQSTTVAAVNLVLLLWFSVPLALTAIAMLVVIAAVFLGMGLWQVRWQRKLVVLNNKLNNQAFQTLRGLPKLRVAAAESFAYAAWAREFARSRELQRRVGHIRNLITVVNAVYLPLCALIMFMLLAGPARGSLSPSAFLTFNTSVTMMLTSVTQLTGALISVAAVLPMFEQLKPVLDERPEVPSGSTQPGTLSGAMEARGVSFRYSDDGPLVLDNVSFQVRPGEFVAIVGASGCGKSTLLRLLIGFDKPTSGDVTYDGQDLSALDQAAVRRQCGVVLQNSQPFTGSILDCICGSEMFSLEEAWEAAAMAGLAEDIKAMPMGMHTVLSDGGGTVSGGQRQRLMIAQALIRKPRILFFDEATSALDNETQRVVIESTRKLRATRIVIAHRLSTVMDADRVVVMSEGRIIQQGRPADLLADTGGLFHELVRRQIQ